MNQTENRYNKIWYDKRIKQNQNIKNFLIDKIFHHKEKGLNWNREELFSLNYEDLFEIAVAAVNKNINIVLGDGQDWSCGTDGKVSVARLNNYGQSYSALVKSRNKKHIRALIYEGIQEKFYFFNFPVKLIEHSIPFNVDTGEPKRYTRNGCNTMWYHWECQSFEEMAIK
jgi:hypothetical protein